MIRLLGLVALVALSGAAAACGGQCNEFCPLMPTTIANVENVAIDSAQSSCANALIDSSSILGRPLASSATCHFEIVLGNGESETFDVPFTNHQEICCCGSCQEGFVGDWSTVAISAPPAFDGSPFPTFDAGDAADM